MQRMASRPVRRLLAVVFVAVVVFQYAPIAVLVVFSFNDDPIPAFPLSGFTTDWYRQLLSNAELLDAVATSAEVAAMVSLIAVVLATLAATGLSFGRLTGRSRAMLMTLFLTPLVVPVVVVGIALFVSFRSVEMPFGRLAVVAGHVVLVLPYVLLVLLPRMSRLNPALLEAARDLGAGPVRAFCLAYVPLLVPALVSSSLVAFVLSFDEYAAASFLAGPDTTFPIYLVSQLRFPDRLPEVMAVASLIIAVSGALLVTAEAGRTRAERRWSSNDH